MSSVSCKRLHLQLSCASPEHQHPTDESIAAKEVINDLQRRLSVAQITIQREERANSSTGAGPLRLSICTSNSRQSIDPDLDRSTVFECSTLEPTLLSVSQLNASAIVSTPIDVNAPRRRQPFTPSFSPVNIPSSSVDNDDPTLIVAPSTSVDVPPAADAIQLRAVNRQLTCLLGVM